MPPASEASARESKGKGESRGGEQTRGSGRGAPPSKGKGGLNTRHDEATLTASTRGAGRARGRGRGASSSGGTSSRPAAVASTTKKPDSSNFFASDSEAEEQGDLSPADVVSSHESEGQEEVVEDAEAIFRRPTLSLSGHPLPATKELAKTLSRFTRLTKLELSGMEPSADSPHGLNSLEWLGAATSMIKTDERFGSRLTTLDVSENPKLNTDAAWKGLESLQRLFVLNATSCALTRLPPASLLPASLRALIMNHNTLASIPDLPFLPQLNTLVISHNKLTALPPSLPAALPALKKLSASHNQLYSAALPDLSACAHLREVRLAGNPLGNLPVHIRHWGKGVGSDARGTGLETLELAECKLAKWEHVASLLSVISENEPDEQGESTFNKRKRGIRNLSFKGNHITSLGDYRDKILAAHPTLTILDGVPVVARPPTWPTDDATAVDNISNSEAEDCQSPAKTGRNSAGDRAVPHGNYKDANARLRDRAGPPPPSDDSRAGKKTRARAGPSQSVVSKSGERAIFNKDARAQQRAWPPLTDTSTDNDRHKSHKRGVRGAKRKRGEVEEIPAEESTSESAATRASLPPIVEPDVASDSDNDDVPASVERKRQKRAKRGKGSATAERRKQVTRMDFYAEDLVPSSDEPLVPAGGQLKKTTYAREPTHKTNTNSEKTNEQSLTASAQAWDAGSPALLNPPVVTAPASATENVPVAKPERTSVVGIVDVRQKAGVGRPRKAMVKTANTVALLDPKADTASQAAKKSAWGEAAGEAWGSGATGDAWS